LVLNDESDTAGMYVLNSTLGYREALRKYKFLP